VAPEFLGMGTRHFRAWNGRRFCSCPTLRNEFLSQLMGTDDDSIIAGRNLPIDFEFKLTSSLPTSF
jgi:hypothetical protein